MRILGVSALYNDSAAALVVDGQVVAAAQEERFTRKKHDSGFPRNAIEYCLIEGKCTLDQLDFIVFYDKPFIKFERLIETYLAFAPRGLQIVHDGHSALASGKVIPEELVDSGAAQIGAVVRQFKPAVH